MGSDRKAAMAKVWARRFKKRQAAVDFMKSTMEYRAYLVGASYPIDEPDPFDATTSKRQWERQVQVWRARLRMAMWSTAIVARDSNRRS